MDSVMRHICLNYLENYKVSQEFKEFFREFYDNYKKMQKSLSGKQKELFDKIMELRDEMDSEQGITHFEYGFKLGLKLGRECFE